MEILSDATFRGATAFKKDVTISGGDFFVTRDDNTSLFYVVRDNGKSDNSEIVHIGGGAHITKGIQVGGGAFIHNGATIYNSLDLTNFNKITANGKSITFPSTTGTLALTSQIPTVPSMAGVAHVCSIPINFNVAADCTLFNIDQVAHDIVPYSLQMFKKSSTVDGEWDFYCVKNIDIEYATNSSTRRGSISIKKSSSFAISASDGYSIRIVY